MVAGPRDRGCSRRVDGPEGIPIRPPPHLRKESLGVAKSIRGRIRKDCQATAERSGMGYGAKVGQAGLTSETQHKHEQNLWVRGGGTNIYMNIWVTHFKNRGHTHTWDLEDGRDPGHRRARAPVRSVWITERRVTELGGPLPTNPVNPEKISRTFQKDSWAKVWA